MKGAPAAMATCIAAIAVPSVHWFRSTDGYHDVLAHLDLVGAGGQRLSSKFPLWQFPNFMKTPEVDAVLSLLPREDGWNNCNRTAWEHKTLPGRSCVYLDVGREPLLQAFLSRLGQTFRADMTRASRVFAVRYRPGSPGVPCHVDKFHDGSVNDLSVLVYLTTPTYRSSGLTIFERAGVSVPARSGTTLAWMSSHINSEHALSPIHPDEPLDRLVLQIGFSLDDSGDSFELPRNIGSAFGGDYT